MFGPFRCSVFRCSVPFEVRSFDIQSFDVRAHSTFSLSMFGPIRGSVFRCSVLFDIRSSDVRSFVVQSFELRSFEVRSFEVRSRFQISPQSHTHLLVPRCFTHICIAPGMGKRRHFACPFKSFIGGLLTIGNSFISELQFSTFINFKGHAKSLNHYQSDTHTEIPTAIGR
jgi:hypothetical protein